MNYVYKVRFFFGKYISLVFGFQNFVIDLIWYCVKFFLGYAAKKNFQHVPVDIVVGRNVAGQNFKIPVRFMRSRKISGRGYRLCPTLVVTNGGQWHLDYIAFVT